MKKILSLALTAALTALLFTSCVSTKQIVYFQGSDTLFQNPQAILQQYEMKLKPADQVLVKVTCEEPELLKIFSQDVVMGNNSANGNIGSNGSGSLGNSYGYTVTNDGCLVLPVIGTLSVDGTTVEECATRIENRIKEMGLIKDPKVTVRLLNARVTVIGAVGGATVVNLTSERNTVIDVLAQCGDVSDDGLRQNLRLYREKDGKRYMYQLDLTKDSVFNSPAFYVQQNDMIYVEPNKSKRVKSSSFYTSLSAWGSIIGAVSTAISLYFLIKKL